MAWTNLLNSTNPMIPKPCQTLQYANKLSTQIRVFWS